VELALALAGAFSFGSNGLAAAIATAEQLIARAIHLCAKEPGEWAKYLIQIC
jgi:hypothetical protein